MTVLPRNIEELRRYSRQERQEITDRLRKAPLESSDQAFAQNARMLRTLIDDETALSWGPKVTSTKDMSLTPEDAEKRWLEQLQREAKRRAENYAAAVTVYMKKKADAYLQPLKQRDAELEDIVTEEAIVNIGDQLRTCRIFVSDKMMRSIAGGARIRNGGKVYYISNGILRQTTVDSAGNKDRPTTEFVAAYELVMRWKRAARKKSISQARGKE